MEYTYKDDDLEMNGGKYTPTLQIIVISLFLSRAL